MVPSVPSQYRNVLFCLDNSNVLFQDFFLPSESFDLIFLKAKIVILCTKGFEIMDLTEYVIYFRRIIPVLISLLSFKSVTIPQRDDPRLEKLAKRCESCRPMGMFRSSKDEFLLCYDGKCLLFRRMHVF